MKVAIIGAGLAGLTTANQLSAFGIDITVFEKSRGVGGRLANKRLSWGNIDIGAQYFTARDLRFQNQVASWIEDNTVEKWEFTPLTVKSNEVAVSPDKTFRFVGSPKMNTVAHSIKNKVAIKFESHVENILPFNNQWEIIFKDQNRKRQIFDWIIVSAPAEQAKILLKNTSIAPLIPEKVHEPCWALALATKGKVERSVNGIFGDDIVSWVSRLNSKPNRQFSEEFDDYWMLHFSSRWSTLNDKNTNLDIGQIGLDWLNKNLSPYLSDPLSAVYEYKHYWRYARVSKQYKDTLNLLVDSEQKVAAIGDWLFGGRVEGAYLSAMKFIDYFLSIYPEFQGQHIEN
jgi:predicted NAD/FAD-dependent oxidoreductase